MCPRARECVCLRWGGADFSRFSLGTGLPAAHSASLGSGRSWRVWAGRPAQSGDGLGMGLAGERKMCWGSQDSEGAGGVEVGKVTVKSALTAFLSVSRAPSGQGDIPPLLLSVHSREWPLPSPWTSTSGTLPPWPRALSLQRPAGPSRSEGGKRAGAEGGGLALRDRQMWWPHRSPPPHPLS